MTKKLYGTVGLVHGYCPNCDDESFGKSGGSCLDCGSQMEYTDEIQRETIANHVRQTPTKVRQRELIEVQDNSCYWCGREFGSMIYDPHATIRELTIHWDHFVPYSYTGSCNDLEFVAACDVCNRFKRNRVFGSEDKCREFLQDRWKSSKFESVEL